ncbi:hypothetical protein N0V90_013311 [Kalmusia sp. IMI 367209]|nr:hypothetical protein N0V90_013311 [Kalmusia sp. IMI 367209]
MSTGYSRKKASRFTRTDEINATDPPKLYIFDSLDPAYGKSLMIHVEGNLNKEWAKLHQYRRVGHGKLWHGDERTAMFDEVHRLVGTVERRHLDKFKSTCSKEIAEDAHDPLKDDNAWVDRVIARLQTDKIISGIVPQVESSSHVVDGLWTIWESYCTMS